MTTAPNATTAAGDEALLPDDLLWAEGGHASDIVLTALADGQRDIVPPPVRSHVERCPQCMTHLGHAALLSLHTADRLQVRAEHDRVLGRRPLPRMAIALGLAAAALGLVPAWADGSGTGLFFTRDVPHFVKGLGTLAGRLDESSGGSFSLLATYGAATLLVGIGIAFARFAPKKEVSR